MGHPTLQTTLTRGTCLLLRLIFCMCNVVLKLDNETSYNTVHFIILLYTNYPPSYIRRKLQSRKSCQISGRCGSPKNFIHTGPRGFQLMLC